MHRVLHEDMGNAFVDRMDQPGAGLHERADQNDEKETVLERFVIAPVNFNEIIREMFDGMSTGTARIIIEREMSREFQEKFNIGQVENQGRYYLAKIVRQDGSIIQRLLVDKQTGNVQMAGR